jgi:hypothetical protein
MAPGFGRGSVASRRGLSHYSLGDTYSRIVMTWGAGSPPSLRVRAFLRKVYGLDERPNEQGVSSDCRTDVVRDQNGQM